MARFRLFCEIKKMRQLFFSILLIICFAALANSQNLPISYEAESFRRIQDKSFRKRQTSPLLPLDFENFKGLEYFPFDAKYRVQAKLVKTPETKSFLMPTSTGGSRKYLKIGDLIFDLKGKEFTLAAFIIESSAAQANGKIRDLFVPFRDLTNGEETYNAGRYVYLKMPKEGEEAILDFNLSHNPNCAYNSNYACTLPPKENFLQIEIEAGEKKFVHSETK